MTRGSASAVLHAAFLLAAVLWPIAIVGAAAAAAERPPSGAHLRFAAAMYVTGAVICHQRPERSFHLRGLPLPVCARCVGLYAAAPFGLIAAVGRRRWTRHARTALLAAAVPTVATVVLEWGGLPVSSGIRALAALPLGGTVAWILDGALRGHFA